MVPLSFISSTIRQALPPKLLSRSTAWLLAAFVSLSVSAGDTKAPGVMQSLESEIQKIFHKTTSSVVQVKTILAVRDAQKGDLLTEALSIGTGFFVDDKGHLLTAASIVRGSTNSVVYWDGKAYDAVSVGQDPRTNLALLKIDAKTTPLPLGDPDALKVGSMAMAVGYPADSPVSVEYGFISNTDAPQISRPFSTAHIRSSIHVQPGQSGSPFLNSKGEVVGIVVYAMEDGSSTFALPITAAQKIQKDLMTYHAPQHGWTGLIVEGNQQTRTEGIGIKDVYAKSPAFTAGIRPGDTLLKIGNKSIHTVGDVMDATFYLSIGDSVDYTILRDGKSKAIPVKVVPRPSDKEMLAFKTVSSSS